MPGCGNRVVHRRGGLDLLMCVYDIRQRSLASVLQRGEGLSAAIRAAHCTAKDQK
jgi:hypothetical protein